MLMLIYLINKPRLDLPDNCFMDRYSTSVYTRQQQQFVNININVGAFVDLVLQTQLYLTQQFKFTELSVVLPLIHLQIGFKRK